MDGSKYLMDLPVKLVDRPLFASTVVNVMIWVYWRADAK